MGGTRVLWEATLVLRCILGNGRYHLQEGEEVQERRRPRMKKEHMFWRKRSTRNAEKSCVER